MKTLFLITSYIHIAIWAFVILGSLVSKNIATFNLYILIPIIYLSHLLPFHIFNTSKSAIITNREEQLKIEDENLIIRGFFSLGKRFKNSFQNPFSAQGMLIAGLIISLYSIRFNLFLIK